MYSELFELYSSKLLKEIDKYKSMYIKCCGKINKQKKIIKCLEDKINDQKEINLYYKKKES